MWRFLKWLAGSELVQLAVVAVTAAAICAVGYRVVIDIITL